MNPNPTPEPRPPVTLDGWQVWELEVIGSTNDAAAPLPAWSAVRADLQTAGRGRHGRPWVADRGGLWLSAVVPTSPPPSRWAPLPLAAGLAVCEALEALGVASLRLRWPNDILVGDRKLAGLLVDQFHHDRAVIGIGMNVTNHPETLDPDLATTSLRLADLLPAAPGLRELARGILGRVRGVVEGLQTGGFAALVARVNTWWRTGVRMDIETPEGHSEGAFLGVGEDGRLRIRGPAGEVQELAPHQVLRARETTGDDRL